MFDRTRRLRLLIALLITASIVIITIDYRAGGGGPLASLGRAAMTVLGPIQEGLARIGRPIGHFVAGFTEVPSLRARIGVLERENAALRVRQEEVADVFRENATLRRLLGLRDRLDLRTMPAQVIGVGPSNFERTLFIDRGTADGVRRGMPVMGGAGLVGRVINAGTGSSEVLLIVDRSCAVAGRLASGGETGTIEGTGGRDLRFELLNPEAKVKAGDQVVTSGYEGGVYPPGIPIGTVTKIPAGRRSLTKIVTVQPFVDFTSLDHVLLVLGDAGTGGGGA
ncbi:MAG: rod shape-determining protein MreC [Acidobacteria bacterium]|nr:rod shape-determining protein MreC [Acidobacteriota bacterium]